MPYSAFIPRTDLAAIPGTDLRKSGYRSWVPCDKRDQHAHHQQQIEEHFFVMQQ